MTLPIDQGRTPIQRRYSMLFDNGQRRGAAPLGSRDQNQLAVTGDVPTRNAPPRAALFGMAEGPAY